MDRRRLFRNQRWQKEKLHQRNEEEEHEEKFVLCYSEEYRSLLSPSLRYWLLWFSKSLENHSLNWSEVRLLQKLAPLERTATASGRPFHPPSWREIAVGARIEFHMRVATSSEKRATLPSNITGQSFIFPVFHLFLFYLVALLCRTSWWKHCMFSGTMSHWFWKQSVWGGGRRDAWC